MKGAKSHGLEVLFEDEWIIIVNKPSGMLSVGYPGYSGKSAQDILTELHRSRGKLRIAVVHRLDRDTSGVMMFATSAEAKKKIMDNWQAIVTERVYRAVCARGPGAEPLGDKGTVDAPLAYNRYDVAFVPRAGDRAALKDAEKAVTHYRVLERGAAYDLVECELETGRKNQIRAHMAHLGHPVAGDEVYGKDIADASAREGGAVARADSGPIGRLALHARILAFAHPFTGEQMRFDVPEPKEFERPFPKRTKTAPPSAGTPKATTKTTTKATPAKRPVSAGPQAGEEVHVPRRQRGKKPVAGAAPRGREREEPRRDKRDAEDTGALAPAPRRSRTRQIKGSSRFIPGK